MPEPSQPPDRPPPGSAREPVQRWRLVLGRAAVDPDLQQRAQQAAWEASLVASGLPLAGLDAGTRRPRFTLAAPLSPSIPGEAELADLWLVERCPAWRVREALGGCLPQGWRLLDAYDVWLGEAALPGQVVGSVYRATIGRREPASTALAEAVRSLLAAASVPRDRAKADRTIAYDLRPFIAGLAAKAGSGDAMDLVMELRHDAEKGVGRPDEVLAELGDLIGAPLEPIALVRERLVLAPGLAGQPGPPAPIARRPPGRVPARRQAR